MHSSGMHTAHLLTISQHALWRGVPARGVYLPRSGVPAQVEYTCPGECTCPGGVPARGAPAQVLPPLVDRQTRVCWR